MATSTIARNFANKHTWLIEPVVLTKPSPFRDGDIDGELYTARYTRGNLKGKCRDCKATRMFHPFSGGLNLTGNYAPVGEPMLSPTPVLTGIAAGEPNAATLA